MQGKSSDLARHAIPSIRKHRIILTFGKSNPKRPYPIESSRIPISAVSSQSTWGAPSGRPSPLRHSSSGLKHYGVVPATTGVLPPPPVHPQHMPPSNGPLFVAPTQAAPAAVPYPTPAQVPPVSSSGWPLTTPPMHPGPRLPVPGTGVFLPPSGSSHSQPQQLPPPSYSDDANTTPEMESQPEEAKANSQNDSSQSVATETMEIKPDCNGNLDNSPGVRVISNEDNQNFNHMKKRTSSKHLVNNAAKV